MTKKGFTVVELVVSFALTAVVIIFLFNMIFGLKDLYINAVIKTELLNKQTIITQRINKELVSKKLDNLYKCGVNCLLFGYDDNTYTRLEIDTEDKTFTFGDFTTSLVKNSSFGEITIETKTTPGVEADLIDTFLILRVPVYYNLFDDENYGVEIIYQYDVDTTAISYFNNSNSNSMQILLLGNSPMTITEPYEEPGYRLKFNDDEIYPNHPEVEITGTVGAKSGTYTLNYTYRKDGAVLASATRTVINTPLSEDFAYTGQEETFYVPVTGQYKLEVWGAAGGKNGVNHPYNSYGGYSTGIVNLTAGTTLNINVGGQGQPCSVAGYCATSGGYNGGGNAFYSAQLTAGGGGATHIAKRTGLLYTLSSNLNDILIVAGGGGGIGVYNGNVFSIPGYGGGYSGVGGSSLTYFTKYAGTGGTQTEGGFAYYNGGNVSTLGKGTFGQGGQHTALIESNGNNGGGGGFYGGGASSRGHDGAGGGSGYIGNSLLISTQNFTKHMTCYKCQTSSAINSYTLSTTKASSTPKSDYAKDGQGYAKITYLGSKNTLTVNLDDGTESELRKYTLDTGETLNLQTPTRENHNFNGWRVSGTGSTINENTFTMGTANATLTATWTWKDTVSFAYSGNYVEYVVPRTGRYKVELWGAQGSGDSNSSGGKGAYTKGITTFTQGDKIYFYVGGQGSLGPGTPGGYNGGGNSALGGTAYRGYHGGGATDIRVFGNYTPTANELLSNSALGLNSRIMVAAGGGGGGWYNAPYYSQGGVGGTLSGKTGTSTHSTSSNIQNTWGTQVSGGYCAYNASYTSLTYGGFGYGGSGSAGTTYGASGGGAGYYGGSGGPEGLQPGGGGSSYISGYLGCVAIARQQTPGGTRTPRDSDGVQCTALSAATDIKCSYHYSGKIFTNTEMRAGDEAMPNYDNSSTKIGNVNDGYAKITYIGA